MACMEAPIDCHYPFTSIYHKEEAVVSGSEASLAGLAVIVLITTYMRTNVCRNKTGYIFPLHFLGMKT